MAKKLWIIFDLKMLKSTNPSARGIKFLSTFMSLTNKGRARLNFSKKDLNKWLFPIFISNTPAATTLLKKYDKAKKL